MTFGLQGSKVLVSVANVFMGKDGKLRKSPLKLNKDDLTGGFKDLQGSLLRTAQMTFGDRAEKLKREREEL